MAEFEVVRHCLLEAPAAWDRLTDWTAHGDHIPFTRVAISPEGPTQGVGTTFVARTQLGPIGFDDPMEVTFWQPPADQLPGRCRIVKRGPTITGWAVLTVVASGAGSTISWREAAGVRLAGPLLNWPNRVAGKIVFARLVDGLLYGSTS